MGRNSLSSLPLHRGENTHTLVRLPHQNVPPGCIFPEVLLVGGDQAHDVVSKKMKVSMTEHTFKQERIAST